MNQHRDYLQTVASECLRCHACRCCHAGSCVGALCYGELAERLLRGRAEELEQIRDSVFTCNMCGLCLKKCPRRFDAKEFMFHARAVLHSWDNTLCRCYDGVRVDRGDDGFTAQLKKLEQTGSAPTDALQADAPCPRLFVPGCHLAASYPGLSEKALTYLKQHDLADGMTTQCCGYPLYAAGLYQQCSDYLQRRSAQYTAHAVRELLTPCPSCYDFALRAQGMGYLQGVQIRYLSQVLVENGIKIRREAFPRDYTVSIHDPCPDRKSGLIAGSVRRLYADFTIRELPHNRADTLCCGCGGLAGLYSPAATQPGKEEKRREFETTGGDALVTACFNCYKGLKPLLPARHYLQDLLEEPLP